MIAWSPPCAISAIVGFEPTGNDHRVLAHRLIAAGFEVRLISSMALARTREALHNGWDKNDPKDAQVSSCICCGLVPRPCTATPATAV
jgi:transposase